MSSSNAERFADVWRRSILEYIAGHPDRPLKTRALARQLDVPGKDYTSFRDLVRDLVRDGSLVLGPGRTLRLPEQTNAIIGTFRANYRGFGFIERPGHPDLYVHRARTCGALDGDTVMARPRRQRGGMPGPRAEVVKILERAPLQWVGLLESLYGKPVVAPQGQGRLPLVHVDNAKEMGAREGELVVIRPYEETLKAHFVRGEIIERLGDPRDARVTVLGLVRRFAIPDQFPDDVQSAARAAADAFDPEAVAGREDLRSLLTVTIDPPLARDFDDAISVEVMPGGTTELGVHIADVAHFVSPGDVVDREARRRGTSAYFPGYVAPMLPESLSNDVCCLRPDMPRLAKSVFITYDTRGRVQSTRIAATLIQSRARLTYEQVTAALETRKGVVDKPVCDLLKRANKLARAIRKRRIDAGMIVLSLPDVEIELNDDGQVVDAGPADTSFSHTIIEMFMVEANEAVSRRLTEAGLQHLRRVHAAPDPDEAPSLSFLEPVLKHRPPTSLDRETINRLLDEVRGKPEEMAVNYVLLRSMPQACYGPSDDGHFALASEDYCHFTSPIRRYPDLTVHRLVDVLLAGDRAEAPEGAVLSDVDLAAVARDANSAERRALQAERAAKKALLHALMEGKIGETFDGIVTGVMSFGVFVQVQPSMAEGLVRVEDFGPDDWSYERRLACFVGMRTRRLVHIGLRLRVQVATVDSIRGELELVPAGGKLIGSVQKVPSTKRPAGRPKSVGRRGRGRGRGRRGSR